MATVITTTTTTTTTTSARVGNKRKTHLRSDGGDDNCSERDEEKTIPFLRRLTDMLQQNEQVISFHPGSRNNNGQVTLGKIVVHDRARVESEVLPRYFNHASFASLRRQLNYFSFTRVGKGRQRGATYCNEAVIVLDDILHLKRRPVGAAVPPPPSEERLVVTRRQVNNKEQQEQQEEDEDEEHNDDDQQQDEYEGQQHLESNHRASNIINSVVPVVHLPAAKRIKYSSSLPSAASSCSSSSKTTRATTRKLSPSLRSSVVERPTIISPASASPIHNQEDEEPAAPTYSEQPRLTLDLTQPTQHSESSERFAAFQNHTSISDLRDADVLAGCQALLSFSGGLSLKSM